jgi:MFS family permease
MPQFQKYFDPLTPAIKVNILLHSEFYFIFLLTCHDYQGALNSLMGCGAVFGCLIAGVMSDRFGRRDTISVASLVFIVGGVLQCASQNIAMQLVGRFVSGISVGACSVLCK